MAQMLQEMIQDKYLEPRIDLYEKDRVFVEEDLDQDSDT